MAKKAPSVKVLKYIKAVSEGKTKKEAVALAGYKPSVTSAIVESTDVYKSLSVKDSILKHISLDEISKIHTKIMRSDNEAVAINAIKLGYERIEPETNTVVDNDKVTVILK
jgi:hypothetical protein